MTTDDNPCAVGAQSTPSLPTLAPGASAGAAQWQTHQWILQAEQEFADPYTEVTVTAQLTGPNGESQIVPGFWNGDREFIVRFTPTRPGRWSYAISATPADPGLAQRGTLDVAAAPADATGFIRRDPAHPYSFVRDNGDRYFMMGQTYYDLMRTACAGDAWVEGVVQSAAHGINKVRIFVHSLGFGPDHFHPDYYPAVFPFLDDDHDRLNLAYWQRLDEVVMTLAEQGMVADLILFMKPYNTDDDLAFGTQAQDERYVRYILARYAAFPNVIWCITNEWEYTDRDPTYWDGIGRIVRAEDPWMADGDALRPLSIHNATGGSRGGKFQFFASDWPVHAIVQYGVRNGQFEYGDVWGHYSIVQNRGHAMPVVNDEYGYIGEPAPIELTRAQHRFALWGIVLGGGYGAAGDFRIFADGPDNQSARVIMTGRWHDAPEYDDIQHLVNFWTTQAIPYWRMTPQQDVAQAAPRVYVLGEAAQTYVVYAATGGTVDLLLPEGDYRVRQFDPRTGSSLDLPDVQGGAALSIPLPDAQDWVLHLSRPSTVP
jgi:hypothetical protein